MHLRALAPRHLDEPIDVVADDGGLGRHRRHQLQLVELGGRFLLRFLRHAGGFDLLLELRKLVRRVLHLAELFLNGLHLLIQVVLALALLHLLLDAAADALLDPQHVDLGVDEAEHVLEARPHLRDLEHLLLLGELERHLARDGVREPARANRCPTSDVKISGGIFLLSFTYWSNRDITERVSTSISRGS